MSMFPRRSREDVLQCMAISLDFVEESLVLRLFCNRAGLVQRLRGIPALERQALSDPAVFIGDAVTGLLIR